MGRDRRDVTGGLFLVGLGIVLLLDQLGVADFGELVGTWWPLVLVFAGLGLIFRSKRG